MSRLSDVQTIVSRHWGKARSWGESYRSEVQQHPWSTCLGLRGEGAEALVMPGHCEHDSRIELFEKFETYYCSGCFSEVEGGRWRGRRGEGEASVLRRMQDLRRDITSACNRAGDE